MSDFWRPTREESQSTSGVLKTYRILERLEWIDVGPDGDAMAAGRKTVDRWGEFLNGLGPKVLWTRCVVEEERREHGQHIARLWMVAGLGGAKGAISPLERERRKQMEEDRRACNCNDTE